MPESRVLPRLAAYVLLLNLLDAGASVYWPGHLTEPELNPWLAVALADGDVPFLLVKMGLVAFGVGLLLKHRDHPASLFAMKAAAVVYTIVAFLHFIGLLVVLEVSHG